MTEVRQHMTESVIAARAVLAMAVGITVVPAKMTVPMVVSRRNTDGRNGSVFGGDGDDDEDDGDDDGAMAMN